MKKRIITLTSGILFALVSLCSCGVETDETSTSSSSSSSSSQNNNNNTTPTPSSDPSEIKAETYVPGTPVKVGLICLHDQNSTTDKNFIDAMQNVASELGTSKMTLKPEYIFTGVDENNQCYIAAKDLVKKGCNIIFSTSFGHQDFMARAAKEFPTVKFIQCGGTSALSQNLGNYIDAYSSIYQGRYLSGYIAGLRLYLDDYYGGCDYSSGFKLGYVASFPYSEAISSYTAFYLGVKEVFNEFTSYDTSLIQMDVKYTYSWYDPTAEASAAEDLCLRGAILLSASSDSMGVPGAGVPNVTYNIYPLDMCPDTTLGYTRMDWSVCFKDLISNMYNDTPSSKMNNHNWFGSLDDGSIVYDANWDSITKNVSQVNKEAVKSWAMERFNEQINGLNNGTRKVFDTSKFTVSSNQLFSAMADIDGDFFPETEALVGTYPNTYYSESTLRSFPYFDLIIDGINVLDD